MSTSPDRPTPRPGGSSAVGGTPARRKWLLPLLIGLAVLIALLLLLTRCGGDEPPTSSSGTPASNTATAPPAGPSTGTPSGSTATGPGADTGSVPEGTVVGGGATLLGAANTAPLTDHEGAQAVAHAVKVQSVPADEGFWVGADAENRLWVQLTNTGGESDYRVKQGDSIDFTGTVKAAEEGFAAKAGMTADEGAAQLTEQGHYLAVSSSDVTFVR